MVCPVVPVHALYPVTVVAAVPNLLTAAMCDAGMTEDLAVKSSRWTTKVLTTDIYTYIYSDIM